MEIKDDDKERRNAVALFRYGLIADLLHWPRGKRGLGEMIAKKTERDHEIPGSRRCRVAPETIRDWLKDYRRGGFDGLLPKVRNDQGQARAIPQKVADLLCMLKEDKPALSVRMVIEAARASGDVSADLELAPATVHRLLSRAGLMERRPEEPTSNDRRRFSFEKAGELWMSDVMHGPAVAVEGKRRRKTYLISFLDDATRVIPLPLSRSARTSRASCPSSSRRSAGAGPPSVFTSTTAVRTGRIICRWCAPSWGSP
jgi:transposase